MKSKLFLAILISLFLTTIIYTVYAGLNAMGEKIINVRDGTDPSDAINKNQSQNFANQTNVYYNLSWTIQDPTNNTLWPKGHPFDGTGNWSIERIRIRTDTGSVTGRCFVVVGDWNTIFTTSTIVETNLSFNSTGVSDSSLSGFTTISNDQKIGIVFEDVSEFVVTNVVVVEVHFKK